VHPVFLLDEAHLLHQDVLDHLHILLNYEWDSKALLSLVLVGLPELDGRLAFRRNRSLYSRLGRRLAIDPLTPADTAEYVRRRLSRAGCDVEHPAPCLDSRELNHHLGNRMQPFFERGRPPIPRLGSLLTVATFPL
jgi:type II secretory pathway predicted ATPase ExeA